MARQRQAREDCKRGLGRAWRVDGSPGGLGARRKDWEEGVGAGVEAERAGNALGGLGRGQQPLVVALPFESIVPLPLLQSPDCIVRRPLLH
jgi:hypothetical protein